MKNLRILVVDDEQSIRHMLSVLLKKEGGTVKVVEDGEEALKELFVNSYDIVLCDVRMPKLDGLQLLDELSARKLLPTVIIMSAFGSRELAIEAIKKGAYDYVEKPFSRDEILLTLLKAAERLQLRRENQKLKVLHNNENSFHGIVGRSEPMRDVFRTIQKVAEYPSTVLISGESGTGKELVARAIHDLSPRELQPYVAINCGAIPESLLESELFGHVKGAFTGASHDKKGLFQEAHQGTIFLDEIAELPLQVQVKLLRILQEGELRRLGDNTPIKVDVRIIAATHHDLKKRVDDKLFREDLFYRLNVIQVSLPALRERLEDIPLLASYFINAYNHQLGTNIQGITPGAMARLMNYGWPGNVRELQNCIERALILSLGTHIDEAALPPSIHAAKSSLTTLFQSDELSIKKMSTRMEKLLITRALEKTSGNRTNAAKLLEISHRALLYKIKEYELETVGQ